MEVSWAAEETQKEMDDKAHHVMTIQTKDRTFRELGADVLLRLQQINPERVGYKELFDYFEKMDDNLKRAKAKALEEKIGSIDDRRSLLYNPVVKMKVTSQGEDVITTLWDVIAAKGFEK